MEQYKEYMQRFTSKRKTWGLDKSRDSDRPDSGLLLQIFAPDITVGKGQCPMAPAMMISNSKRLLDAMYDEEDERYVSNVLSMVREVCEDNMLPGIGGAGQTSIEVPLINVSNSNFSSFSGALEKCLNARIQHDSFRNRQEGALRFVLDRRPADAAVAASSSSSSASSSRSAPPDYVYFCGLPESGGMSRLTIGVRHVGNRKNLVVSIDSYWKPAASAFSNTLAKCSDLLLNGTDKQRVESADVIDAIVCSLAGSYARSKQNGPFCARASNGRVDGGFGTPNNMRFRCASVEYMEAMSRFHRLCVLTKVLLDIYANVIVDSHQVIEDPSRYMPRENIPIPSLGVEGAALAGEHALCGSSSRPVKLIDPRYCAEAVHSTRRVTSDGRIWFLCRHGLMKDLLEGRLHIAYGDVGQGLFSVQSSSESISDKYEQLSKRSTMNTDLRRLYAQQHPIGDLAEDTCFVDIIHPRWLSTNRNFTACGVRFSKDRVASTSFVSKTVHHQEYYRSMEPYLPVHIITNPASVAPAIFKYFEEQYPDLQARDLRGLSLLDPMLTIVCSAQIDDIDLRELVERSARNSRAELILSEPHIGQLWSLRLGRLAGTITSNERARIDYGENRSYYRIDAQQARQIAQTLRLKSF